MSLDPQSQYEIFLSYSRQDNVPTAQDTTVGWVTALRDHILEDHRRFSTEPLRIFFDAEAIRDMDDWRHRILEGLRASKILLVCLSPSYFASEYCRWEWEEYSRRQVHSLIGHESIASVYFVEVPGSDEQKIAKWFDELTRGNFTDIRPWFPAGMQALQLDAVQQRMAVLGESLWERIQRARRATSVPGNLRRRNPFFVGRRAELRQLHEQLRFGTVGVVTAVHGLGGQGKTELAVAYAHDWADGYPAGLWVLGAEGKKELLPLLGELAFAPEFGFTPTTEQRHGRFAAARQRIGCVSALGRAVGDVATRRLASHRRHHATRRGKFASVADIAGTRGGRFTVGGGHARAAARASANPRSGRTRSRFHLPHRGSRCMRPPQLTWKNRDQQSFNLNTKVLCLCVVIAIESHRSVDTVPTQSS